MKKTLATLAVYTLPVFALAQTVDSGGAAAKYVGSIVDFLNKVIVPGVIAIALFVFIWGMFQYFILGGADEEKRKKGKQFVMWSIAGFVLMLSIQGIVNLVANFMDLQGGTIKVDVNPFGQN